VGGGGEESNKYVGRSLGRPFDCIGIVTATLSCLNSPGLVTTGVSGAVVCLHVVEDGRPLIAGSWQPLDCA
jgi:hypothetical protein